MRLNYLWLRIFATSKTQPILSLKIQRKINRRGLVNVADVMDQLER
jgi:hypothetical protein